MAVKVTTDRELVHGTSVDVVTEAEALTEMLVDLEDACDPRAADLREELASRLRLICGSC